MNIAMPLFVLILAIASPFTWAEEGPLDLKSEPDRKLALKLNAAVKKASEAVTACVGKGKDALACRCESKAEVEAFNNEIKETIKLKPEWKTKSLLVMEKTGSVSLSMPALVKASEMKPCRDAK